MSNVDVAAVVEKAVASKKEKLNWKTSIVDLMKALDLDSSLAARKELAKELHYTGDTDDSAKMNIWLHQQVMKKLAENGGVLPADIRPEAPLHEAAAGVDAKKPRKPRSRHREMPAFLSTGLSAIRRRICASCQSRPRGRGSP